MITPIRTMDIHNLSDVKLGTLFTSADKIYSEEELKLIKERDKLKILILENGLDLKLQSKYLAKIQDINLSLVRLRRGTNKYV